MKKLRSFEVLGTKVKVKYSKSIKKAGALGLADLEKNEITIQKDLKPDMERVTVLHEILHVIFNVLGEHELCNNEKIIDTTANVLYQIEKTSKYR